MPQDDSPTKTLKHEEATRRLREMARALAPGERFPSQNELMRFLGVSDRTVLRALEELRRDGWIVRRAGSGTFVTDRAASAQDAGRGTLAVMALGNDRFFRHWVGALTAEAETQGLRVVYHYGQAKDDFGAAQALEALSPAGFLVLSHGLVRTAEFLGERGHAVTLIGAPPQEVMPPVPCVFGDQEHGASLLVERLLALGHRRFAFAHRQPSEEALRRSRRWQGFTGALARAGLGPDVATLGSDIYRRWREEPGEAKEAFSRPDAPSALVVWTDEEAVGWLSLLWGAGLRVPEDVSVCGYDNVPGVSDVSRPPLDTVDQHAALQVRRALEMLQAHRRGGKTAPSAVVVTPTLVTRESCAPPRS